MEFLTLADVKNRFSEVVKAVEAHQRVVVTKHGKPSVVLISVGDLEGLETTLEVMSDPGLMADIAEARTEAGEVLTREEVMARWAGRG